MAALITLLPFLGGFKSYGNLLSRPDQSLAITSAQAVGVFASGIGFIAIRLATRSLVAVMVVHYLFDLFLQLRGMPSILANVIIIVRTGETSGPARRIGDR